MILPSKHLSQDRALLTVGARLLGLLSQPKTVSALWEEVSRSASTEDDKRATLRYDAFVLTLDLLCLLGTIELRAGLLSRKTP
jgi:hypothetical protein